MHDERRDGDISVHDVRVMCIFAAFASVSEEWEMRVREADWWGK